MKDQKNLWNVQVVNNAIGLSLMKENIDKVVSLIWRNKNMK